MAKKGMKMCVIRNTVILLLPGKKIDHFHFLALRHRLKQLDAKISTSSFLQPGPYGKQIALLHPKVLPDPDKHLMFTFTFRPRRMQCPHLQVTNREVSMVR